MKKKICTMQYVIDEIPEDYLLDFHSLMSKFQSESNCRWQYKKGRSVKYSLHPVPIEEKVNA